MRATTLTLFDPAFVAQVATTPSGLTPAFYNPTRWYDAASFSGVLTNDAVISPAFPWDDQSPNDDDAASTNGNEPTFHTNAINGRPIVRFAGANHMLFEGGDLVLSDFTVLAVVLSASDSNYLSHSSFNRQIRTNYLNQARASWFVGESGSELTSNQFLSNLAAPRMVGHRRLGTAPGSAILTFRFFDNLTEVMPTTNNVHTALFGINQIGHLGNFTPTPAIDIAELVIYNTALTTDEIRTLYNSYFKPKFALP